MAGNAKADGVVSRLIGEVPIPKFYRVRQKFDGAHIEDVPAAVAEALRRPGTLDQIRAGQKVAIAAGSRGIGNIAAIARALADAVRAAGAAPFFVPAMGSHGGATAEGQAQVLADYGITERSMGCPVVSSMETVRLGETGRGVGVYFDKNAYGADAVVLMNRVKPHTDFRGPHESGLVKQIVIGLGKQDGACACHRYRLDEMSANIRDAAALALSRTNVAFGLGIVENAYDQTALVSAVPKDRLFDEERQLLEMAYKNMPSILLSPIDVLIIDEIGKDISGAGMDPNITGRFPTNYATGGADAQRCVVLDLTEQSHGNGLGIGVADYSVTRAFDKFDFEASYSNIITNFLPQAGKLPVILANDLLAIRAAIKTCNDIDYGKPAIIRIKNTLSMEYMYISEALLGRAEAHPSVELAGAPDQAAAPGGAGAPVEFAFDGRGNIDFDIWRRGSYNGSCLA